jgi:putative redox protein
MGEQKLVWTGLGLQFVGHPTYGNPLLIGGDLEGPGAKPADLLPLSLAACTCYDVVVILRKQRQDLRELEVTTTTTQDPDPPWRFRTIHMHFRLSGGWTVPKPNGRSLWPSPSTAPSPPRFAM